MEGINPQKIEIDGMELKVVTIEGQKLVSVKDLTLGLNTKETPYWIYAMCQANKNEFKKVSVVFKLHNHETYRPQWFATVNGMKSIYQELVKKYGISSYTKKFYLFTGKIAAALMEKPKPQEKVAIKDLVVMKDQQALTTSLKVAQVFKRQHHTVLDAIRSLFAKSTRENSRVKRMFAKSTYVNKHGLEQPMYYMNRDGFTLLAMGFTGKEALQFKIAYIEAFNKMEAYIRSQQSQADLPQTPEQKLALTMQVTNRLIPRVDNLEKDVNYLKNKSEINSMQRGKIASTVKAKCVQACGGKRSSFYKQRNKGHKVFAQLYQDLYRQFSISRYEDLAKDQYNEALKFINNWHPHTELQQEINQFNGPRLW